MVESKECWLDEMADGCLFGECTVGRCLVLCTVLIRFKYTGSQVKRNIKEVHILLSLQ